jgi:hypothetical protein
MFADRHFQAYFSQAITVTKAKKRGHLGKYSKLTERIILGAQWTRTDDGQSLVGRRFLRYPHCLGLKPTSSHTLKSQEQAAPSALFSLCPSAAPDTVPA